jgi:diguanylate cyclase (GGDEF)-like protein
VIVAKTRKFNLIFLIALLSVGILSALLAVYFLPDQWLIVVAVAAVYAIFCSILIYYELNNEKKVIRHERERAEVAETYIKELQQYVNEQDQAIESLKDSKEKFRHAAFHDALTDLPNRNLFLETLKFILEKHKQTPNYNFAILFLDLNRFKTINDSLGHSTGDRLILNVAKRLTDSVKEGDLVARFSGDEFGIILNNVAGIEETVIFADFIKQKIASPFSIAGREVYSSVSIGIAMASRDYEEADEILRDADIAMYHAKQNTKGIEIFNRAMHTRALTLLQIETDLRYALERNELSAYFQPIIDLGTMQLVGFESLVRWNHPTRGMIPPSEFIPVSEDTNLIIPMTLWMLHHSCEQLAKWQSKSPLNKNLFLSVNLSGKHFAHRDLVNQVRRIVISTKIDPSTLKLELTESAVMENPETVIKMLKELKELGVQLSIDDFGTGYSSLSYLHRFPIDTLKVDRSFVSTMEDGTENGEIVRTVISLAKTLGMNVVAEGIETVHQLHQLRILRCEYGQGYLFSRPVPLGEAEQMIDDKFRWQKILPPNPNGNHQIKQQPIQIGLTQ